METEVNTNDMDLKLLKVRIDFLEAQLAAMKRELAMPKAVGRYFYFLERVVISKER